ncbi:7399_t:CDS:1, partial [Racocetra fulgida]
MTFTNLLNNLLTQYNQHENPTANWKFWWVRSYERYATGLDGRAYGNGHINMLKMGYGFSLFFAALFADNALIILEINDALSDITKNTVGVNLAPVTNYSNPIINNNIPINNIPVNSVPINVNTAPINNVPINN